MRMTRTFPARHDQWHPYAYSVPVARGLRSGGAVRIGLTARIPVEMGQPAGPVLQPGTDHPYQGMDPSDPATYVRPYRPAGGMIAWLNFDGAVPNVTQTTGGPRRSWSGLTPRRHR